MTKEFISDETVSKTTKMPERKVNKKYKVGIAGVGMVGGALKKYFENKPNYDLYLYDRKFGSLEDLEKADYIYLCLPTPYVPGIGCDTRIVRDLIDHFDESKVFIIKSTVIPGTTDDIQSEYPQHKILFNPEFLTEETADQDMRFPDSQILGFTNESFNVTRDVLQQLPLASHERIVPAKIAEFIKYAKNTWFSVKVAKNNEMYDLCKKFGLSEEDWEMVVDGIAADRRIGRTHLKIMHRDKRGYHGKCLPKDTKALLDFAEKLDIKMSILSNADKYNDDLLKKQGYKTYL
jgi:UDPglucose 6-dehydrogenase